MYALLVVGGSPPASGEAPALPLAAGLRAGVGARASADELSHTTMGLSSKSSGSVTSVATSITGLSGRLQEGLPRLSTGCGRR